MIPAMEGARNGMKFFTSDQHFFDPAIMVFSDRPYSSPEEMNEAMIRNFEARVSDGDEVYILGDIFGGKPPADQIGEMKSIFKRLGIDRRPFHLVKGNHDKLSDDDYISVGFRTVKSGFTFIEAAGRRMMLTHDPCMVQPRDTLAICGHIHTLFSENWAPHRNTFTVNVSVEMRGYAPVSEDEIADIIARSPYSAKGE